MYALEALKLTDGHFKMLGFLKKMKGCNLFINFCSNTEKTCWIKFIYLFF